MKIHSSHFLTTLSIIALVGCSSSDKGSDPTNDAGGAAHDDGAAAADAHPNASDAAPDADTHDASHVTTDSGATDASPGDTGLTTDASTEADAHAHDASDASPITCNNSIASSFLGSCSTGSGDTQTCADFYADPSHAQSVGSQVDCPSGLSQAHCPQLAALCAGKAAPAGDACTLMNMSFGAYYASGTPADQAKQACEAEGGVWH